MEGLAVGLDAVVRESMVPKSCGFNGWRGITGEYIGVSHYRETPKHEQCCHKVL